MDTTAHTFEVDDTLPSLVIGYPSCGHCGNDVHLEDGYAYCETCRIQWDRIDDGATATPDPNEEGTEVLCEIVPSAPRAQPEYDYKGKRWSLGPPQPCILPSGHESDHINPHTVTTIPLTEA